MKDKVYRPKAKESEPIKSPAQIKKEVLTQKLKSKQDGNN